MKILVASDSFKDCMTSLEIGRTIKKAIMNVDSTIEIEVLPVGDGGEGTLEVLTVATDGKFYEMQVTGPLGEPVKARYAILGDDKTAVVEMAEASGIQLVAKENRNPLLTTSFGTGELIKAALNHDIDNLIVTVGGSATNDGGVGMLQALGARFLTNEGVQVGFGGQALIEINEIDLSNLDDRLKQIDISIACDVTNPLSGPNGASRIYGPQKGATDKMIEQLDNNLSRLAVFMENELGTEIATVPGAGAAGGLGAGLLACGGSIHKGIDLVLETIKFEEKLSGVDYIFTGEGKIDSQTPNGKVIAGITATGFKHAIPVIAFAGSLRPGYEPLLENGLLSAHSITLKPCSLEEAIQNGKTNLLHTVENVVRLLV